MQPVSVDLFEQFVFGKIYFDREGLILAFDEGRPVGFAHAAFGPNAARDRIATDQGTTCIVMVRPDCARAEVAGGLLERCEAYLRRGGAKVLYGGAFRPLDPFYLGLYGGSGLPGVLDSDTVAGDLYRLRGYDPIDRTLLFRRSLDEFRPLVDRRQVQFRRRMSVELKMDPPAQDWWEACTTGDFDLTRFELTERGGDRVLAFATYRGVEPRSGSGPGRMVGLLDLEVGPEHRRQGFATFLLGESLRQHARHGVAGVEALLTEENRNGVGLFEKLGLEQVEQGTVFCKEAG
jgi:GNAT superfamily N-acetyltransferase